MKKYPIRFYDNYIQYEEWANDHMQDEFTRNHFQQEINDNPRKLEQCKKWTGKELTLQEVEENILEFGEIIFNGKEIIVDNNGYPE